MHALQDAIRTEKRSGLHSDMARREHFCYVLSRESPLQFFSLLREILLRPVEFAELTPE